MKISQKQASLLAEEVFKKLKKHGIGEISEVTLLKLRAFKKRQNELKEAARMADAAVDRHNDKFESIAGTIRGMYYSDSLPRIIQKIKEGNQPTLTEIENKIILQSMFANEMDMEQFVDSIVKVFAKKKHSPVTA